MVSRKQGGKRSILCFVFICEHGQPPHSDATPSAEPTTYIYTRRGWTEGLPSNILSTLSIIHHAVLWYKHCWVEVAPLKPMRTCSHERLRPPRELVAFKNREDQEELNISILVRGSTFGLWALCLHRIAAEQQNTRFTWYHPALMSVNLRNLRGCLARHGIRLTNLCCLRWSAHILSDLSCF